MTNPKSIDLKDFGKFHNTTRLETIVIDCIVCLEPTTHIYIGNFKIGNITHHMYSCMVCETKYINQKKLK